MFRRMLFLGLAGAIAALAALTPRQRAEIDRITGAKGVYTDAEDVYKVSFPRNDLKVMVDGWPMQPFMGTTSWAAFTSGAAGHAIVMGDLALVEDEVNPVMSAALFNGLEVTALHNHFIFDRPRVMFMHIGGHGSVEELAAAVRAALQLIGQIRKANPAPRGAFPGGPVPPKSAITPGPIEQTLGVKGQANNGMYKVTIGRTATAHGRRIGAQMGVNTWAAFAGTDDNAFVDGDFVMREPELQGVLKALRKHGVNIVAIHNHMSQEEPRYVFLHYWGKGTARELARAVRAALDTQSP